MKRAIRAAIVRWLGYAYDPNGDYPGNPDYYDSEQVDALVAQIMAIVEGAH